MILTLTLTLTCAIGIQSLILTLTLTLTPTLTLARTSTTQVYTYEQSSLSLQVVSATEVWVAAGPVGALEIDGFVYHTTTAGRAWHKHTLVGMGMVMDISMLGGSKGGYATACDIALSRCGVWKYVV